MLIGLVGRRGTGKDTVADYLAERYSFHNRKFAGPLKEALASLFGLSHEHLEGALKEVPHPKWGVSPRAMMQFFGTEVMQTHMQRLIPHMGNHHAVHRLFMDLDAATHEENVVVSDVRFPHEVAALRARGALIVRVARDLPSREECGVDNHVSETGVDDLQTDAVLDNNRTLEELYRAVDTLIKGRL